MASLTEGFDGFPQYINLIQATTDSGYIISYLPVTNHPTILRNMTLTFETASLNRPIINIQHRTA
jgi:hypothetical protein